MIPILPKGSGVPQMQGVFSSPRTTIILAPPAAPAAPTLPLGNPLSSPLILPAPPTSTITLAAHRVPQPTPVIFPLTKTSPSSNVPLQCPLLAPRTFPPRTEAKDQQTTAIGKDTKRRPCKKNKDRRNGKQTQSKFSNSETPILPKRPQPDPHTVILLPSASGKAVTLSPSIVVPKCSLVISDNASSHTTVREGKKTKKENKNCSRKLLNKVKEVNQEKLYQSNKDEPNRSTENKVKFDRKQKQVDNQDDKVDEASKMKPVNVHWNVVREASSASLGENDSSVAFILSADGYLTQPSNFSHQRDVPHHPPPPYPQDSMGDVSSSSESPEAKEDVTRSPESVSEPVTPGPKLFHVKRKKCEWKHKRHSISERLASVSNNAPLPEKRAELSSKNDGLSGSHIPPPAALPSSSTNLSLDTPLERTFVSSKTAVAPSCPSSPSYFHSTISKNKNVCKSDANYKTPSHEPQSPLPASSSSPQLPDAQTLLFTPGKSTQSKSVEHSNPLSTSTVGVSVAGVSTGSSLLSELSSTQSASHAPYCSQTHHQAQSPASSMPHESGSSIPSSVASLEFKSGANVSSQGNLHFTLNAQRIQCSMSHLDGCDQAPNSPFYFQPPQCNASLHSALHSHSSSPCTEAHTANTASFSSYMPSQEQSFTHKVTSHSSSFIDSSHPSSYVQSLQPTSYLDSPHVNPYTQPTQLKLITKSPHSVHMPSPQLPSYTQSSKSLSYTQSMQGGLKTAPDHSSPSAAQVSSSQISYIQTPHPYLDSEHAACLQPTLCGESQHEKSVSDQHSPQAVPFSEYASSYHPSPQGGPHSQPSHTPHVSVENLPAIPMYKDNPQSPVLSLYAGPSSQCYADSSNIPYTSEQPNTHEPHYYSLGKCKALASSSVDVSSPHFILEKSLNPPSYEAHIQNSASYIVSESSEQVTQDSSQHGYHQTSPTNYSLSCHIVRDQGTQSTHEDAKRNVNSASSCPSPLLSLTSSPRYSYSQQIPHADPHIENSIIADIAQGAYDYDIEESSQTYFPPSTPEAQLPLPADTHPGNSVEYSTNHDPSDSQGTSIHVAPHCVQLQGSSAQTRLQSSHSRMLVYPVAKQEYPYKNSEQEDLGLSGWNARSAGHGENVKLEKLLFIPHPERNRLYMKKESSKNVSSGEGAHLSKDMMLKKFWIEEDEPIAEEILSSLPSRVAPPHTLPAKQDKARQMLCQICGKMLRGRNSLRCHLNSHHNIQPHSCSTCGKKFTNRSVLVEHLRIHTGETPYSCSLCSAAFRTRSGLLKHGSMHRTARPFECSMCSKKFKTKLVLQQHMKLHLSDVFTCSDCGKTFERKKSLAVHKAFHHHKTQRFKCPHCPKGYHFQSLLNRHMQLHSNVQKHVCSVCGKSFVWRSGLVAHMKTHSTTRPKCDICDLRFASEKRLESHYQQHSNPKPHQCKVCGRSFSHAYRLASHSLVHQEHKEYVCRRCDIVFTNAKKFRKHLVTHKKEEPRICRLSGTVEVLKPIL